MPSLAEAYGLAPCEANAFGVPALTSATGGLNDIIREGQNGFALPLGTPPAAYAQKILQILADGQMYHMLCRGSRQEYEERLNWDAAGRRMKVILNDVLTGRRF